MCVKLISRNVKFGKCCLPNNSLVIVLLSANYEYHMVCKHKRIKILGFNSQYKYYLKPAGALQRFTDGLQINQSNCQFQSGNTFHINEERG